MKTWRIFFFLNMCQKIIKWRDFIIFTMVDMKMWKARIDRTEIHAVSFSVKHGKFLLKIYQNFYVLFMLNMMSKWKIFIVILREYCKTITFYMKIDDISEVIISVFNRRGFCHVIVDTPQPNMIYHIQWKRIVIGKKCFFHDHWYILFNWIER